MAPMLASTERTGGRARRGRRQRGLDAYSTAAVVVAALAVAAIVGNAGAGAYWLCVPVAALGAATAQARALALLFVTLAIGAAAVPALLDPRVDGLPSGVVALAVPILSAAAARLVREQLEADRVALQDLARLDPLTGLLNRRALDDRLGYEVSRHKRHGRSFALVMLDLDGFKAINERFGHGGGDELLRDVGRALRRAVREQDTVARLGGDEFCVLAPETSDEEAERLVERLREAVGSATVGFEELSGSVGCAIFPDDGQSAPAMLTAADAAQAGDKRQRRREHERPPLEAVA
jgi:diguanylate cyclase (GGDEF)-like protein